MSRMKKLLSVLFVLFIVGSVYGQSSKVISQILEEDEISSAWSKRYGGK